MEPRSTPDNPNEKMGQEAARLVAEALSGASGAFDQLVSRYERKATAVAIRMVGQLEDGLEVSQDSFIRAYQSLHQLKEPHRFGPWLMRIVTNQALNYRRRRGLRRMVSLSEPSGGEEGEDSLASRLAGDEPGVYEKAAAKELSSALQEAIETLPEKLRTALMLFTVEKLPQKEIAEIMDCGVQNVKWYVFEARRQLRKKMQKWL